MKGLVFLAVFSLCSPFKVVGNWPDSYVYDETILFMNHLRPDLLDLTESTLNYGKIDNIPDILIAMKDVIDETLFGLLNLSLHFRIFHPKASLLNPIPNTKAILRGYTINSLSSVEKFNSTGIYDKLYTQLYSYPSVNDKFTFLAQLSSSFKTVYPLIENNKPRQEVKDDFDRLNFPPQGEFSLINGREVSPNPIDIVNTLVSEYQTKMLANAMQLNTTDFLTYSRPNRPVRHYLPLPPRIHSFLHHDYHKSLEKEPSKFKVNTSFPEDFVRMNKILIKPQVFLSLSSSQTPAVLNRILEINNSPNPYFFQICLIGDLTNETEKQIIYAFVQTMESLGSRVGVKFLINGFESGNFKSAYHKTRPSLKWDKIHTLYDNSTVASIITEQDNFCKQFDIHNFTIFINNNPVYENPAFSQLLNSITEEASMIMEMAKDSVITEETNMDTFIRETGIHLKSLYPPIKIDRKNYFSFQSSDIGEIMNVINDLTMNPGDDDSLPVFYIDSHAATTDSLPFKSHIVTIDSSTLSQDAKKLLRIKGPSTIIGGVIFDHPLDSDELEYAMKYVKSVFGHQLPHLTFKQAVFVYLWRASQAADCIVRRPRPNQNYRGTVSSPHSKELQWDVRMNPLSRDFKSISQMVSIVVENGAARVSLLPIPGNPSELFVTSYLVFSEDTVDIPPFTDISLPSCWQWYRYSENITVTGIAQYAFSDVIGTISIGGIKKETDKDGLFMTLLPVGSHDMSGPGLYQVDEFIPKQKWYECYEVEKVTEYDTSLHLLTFLTHPSQEKNLLSLVHSLSKNSQQKVKVWMMGHMYEDVLKDVEIINVPYAMPFFLKPQKEPAPLGNLLKYILPDLLFPANVQTILFADQNVIFIRPVQKLLELNMSKYSLAIPMKGLHPKYHYSERDYRMQRFDRPYLSSLMFRMSLPEWRNQNAGHLFRHYYMFDRQSQKHMFHSDNDLISKLQLKIQLAILPENTCFCAAFSDKKHYEGAMSVSIYDESCHDYIPEGIYEEAKKSLKL